MSSLMSVICDLTLGHILNNLIAPSLHPHTTISTPTYYHVYIHRSAIIAVHTYHHIHSPNTIYTPTNYHFYTNLPPSLNNLNRLYTPYHHLYNHLPTSLHTPTTVATPTNHNL